MVEVTDVDEASEYLYEKIIEMDDVNEEDVDAILTNNVEQTIRSLFNNRERLGGGAEAAIPDAEE